jgi:hypothetical protein
MCTDGVPDTVVTYPQFLERQARRRRMVVALEKAEEERTIDGETVDIAAREGDPTRSKPSALIAFRDKSHHGLGGEE